MTREATGRAISAEDQNALEAQTTAAREKWLAALTPAQRKVEEARLKKLGRGSTTTKASRKRGV